MIYILFNLVVGFVVGLMVNNTHATFEVSFAVGFTVFTIGNMFHLAAARIVYAIEKIGKKEVVTEPEEAQ